MLAWGEELVPLVDGGKVLSGFEEAVEVVAALAVVKVLAHLSVQEDEG